ncbi:hypothetical protein [Haloferula rosea]|uniref:hypothetical protein n=1 Tax=Haloferula rosea TaxID=490093 RepID=UPI002D7F331F|nr:hypothetical protein [Haloferula rosea]
MVIRHDSEGPLPSDLIERMTGSNAQVKLVLGHLSARFHQVLPDVRYLVCLRDPVGRIRSHHEHAKADASHYLHEAARTMSLGDYALSGLSGELRNGMVRMLAGVEDFDQAEVDHSTLATALEVLRTRTHGCVLTSDFDETLLSLSGRMGWKTPWYIRRKVGRGDRQPLDPGVRQVIEEVNRFDTELYRCALESWRAEQGTLGPGFGKEVDTFRRKNRTLGRAVFLAREACRRIGADFPA